MKFITHPAITALGITILCLMSLLAPLISPSHLQVYHLSAPWTAAFAPVIFTGVLLWGILFALLKLVERASERKLSVVWLGILLLLPAVILKNILKITAWRFYPHTTLMVLAVSAGLFVLIQVAWRPSFLSVASSIRHVGATILGFVALSGIVILGQVLWCGWQARELNSLRALHRRTVPQASVSHPRIIWIIFDELSFRQAYEHRAADLQLPAFDKLASQATMFTHVVPAGDRTRAVVPSLMTGVAVDKVRASAAGDLWIHEKNNGRWQPFDASHTIFQQALEDGYSTGIAGWYNPYCRILPGVLDRCFWIYHDPDTPVDTGEESRPMRLSVPVREMLSRVRSLASGRHQSSHEDVRAAEMRIADYKDLYAAADDMLNDPSLSFLLLHMPVPHPWGFYNRSQQIFTTGRSSYLDNLALADLYLAHVHDLLAGKGEWDSSTVVVMGDHSWRTQSMWKGASSQWTSEDEAASEGGQFDDRPAYMVKLPNQQSRAEVDAPFQAIRTRALFNELLNHRLVTPNNLAGWAARNP
jgi:hypothetical protein